MILLITVSVSVMAIIILRGHSMWVKRHAGFALLSVLIVTGLMTIALMSHFELIQSTQALLQQDYANVKHHIA